MPTDVKAPRRTADTAHMVVRSVLALASVVAWPAIGIVLAASADGSMRPNGGLLFALLVPPALGYIVTRIATRDARIALLHALMALAVMPVMWTAWALVTYLNSH